MFQGFYSSEPSPRQCHELVAELKAPQDPHIHFTTFKNSIFVQKGTLVNCLAKCLTLDSQDLFCWYKQKK